MADVTDQTRSFSFTVHGEPVPCARARVFARGDTVTAITPATTKTYQRRIAMSARAARPTGWPTTWASYAVTIRVYRSVRRGDFDNYAKQLGDSVQRPRVKRAKARRRNSLAALMVEDALRQSAQAILWENDSQISEAHVYLIDDLDNPRLEVIVELQGDMDVEADCKARAKVQAQRRKQCHAE